MSASSLDQRTTKQTSQEGGEQEEKKCPTVRAGTLPICLHVSGTHLLLTRITDEET